MKLIISVTREDINNGIRLDVAWCPIALVLKRHGADSVCVDGFEVDGYLHNRYFRAKLPKKAKLFLKQFDNDKPVKPLSFTLNYK